MTQIIDWHIDQVFHAWTINGESEPDAEIVLTMPALENRHHALEKIDASYSDVLVSGALTIKMGERVIGPKYIHGAGALDFPTMGRKTPNPNEAITITLTKGAGGATGSIIVSGYTTAP